MSFMLRSTASEARVASSREDFKSIGVAIDLGSHPTYSFSMIFADDRSRVREIEFLKSLMPTKL